jgi:hypothetical protein
MRSKKWGAALQQQNLMHIYVVCHVSHSRLSWVLVHMEASAKSLFGRLWRCGHRHERIWDVLKAPSKLCVCARLCVCLWVCVCVYVYKRVCVVTHKKVTFTIRLCKKLRGTNASSLHKSNQGPYHDLVMDTVCSGGQSFSLGKGLRRACVCIQGRITHIHRQALMRMHAQTHQHALPCMHAGCAQLWSGCA